ncbi:hypothetical protein G6F23_014444 [Rhizopus arrhizus]|nr:hypothetical protein G6F23_014444 [Rhizopus arrhizus]
MVGEHGIDEVAVALLRLDQGKQRMQCTVGVPQRKRGVIRVALRLVHGVVRAAVLAVGIHEQRRPQHGVVQRGVGTAACMFRCIDIEHRQRLRPFLLAMAPALLTGEMATFTTSGASSLPNANVPTSCRPSICARCAGSFSPGGGKPL